MDNLTITIAGVICAAVLLFVLAPVLKRKGYNWHVILHAVGVALCAFALFMWATESVLFLPYGD